MYNQSFKCYDSRGEELRYVYQWDTNRKIKFIFSMYWSKECLNEDDAGYKIGLSNVFAHFCNHRMNKTLNVECTSDVKFQSTNVTGYECTIPNVLLTQPDDLEIFIYEEKNSGGEKRTLAKVVIPIIQRPMPQEYIYRDDVPIADDLSLEDGVLSLSQNGVPFGTAVTIPE